MTDKCWFVLRHAHHNPPAIPENGIGKSRGSLSIGHIITSTKFLDIINPETAPVEYPPSMPVVAGRVYDFEWKTTDEGRINISTGVEAPIAAVLGVDIGMNAGIAFQKAVDRCWEFEKLETFTVNITQSYVDDSVETAEVESYIQRHKEWLVKNPSLYIITGIMVGRTAKLSESSTKGRGVNAGAGANASEIAGATGEFDVSRSKTFSSSQRLDDFVFAIRVAKITKGLLDKTWSWATLSEGASFGAGDNSKETIELIKANLEASAHVYERVVGLGGTAGDIFIL